MRKMYFISNVAKMAKKTLSETLGSSKAYC